MSKLRPGVSTDDHIQGAKNAPIEMVEYGDYQCPHCGRAHPIIKNVQEVMGDKLKFVFRNFPLQEVHPNAMHAAVAAEAAGVQGKFWEMHDTIYENQHRLDDASLVKYAVELGLNIQQFETDFEKPQYLEKVENNFESGVRSGVNGTPTFFINGEKYSGDWGEADLLSYLQALAH